MEKILLLAHIEEDGSLGRGVYESISAAQKLIGQLGSDANFSVGLVGDKTQQAADSLAGCGAGKFFSIQKEEFFQPRYSTDAAAGVALFKQVQPTVVIVPGTSRWSRCIAGVATRVAGKIDTHITDLDVENGKISATRWFYRQRIEARFSRGDRPWFVVVDAGSFTPWAGQSGKAELVEVPVDLDHSQIRTRMTGYQQPAADEQTIRPDAELLFVAGAGWTKKQPDGQVHTAKAAELIKGFLQKTSCSLGSSKSLVDMDAEGQGVLPFLSHLNQVGQTGSTPRHPKGLATCCHGEEPHTVGWRFVKERRAINLNPNCGWAQGKADVLYVADAFQVMAKVNEIIG